MLVACTAPQHSCVEAVTEAEAEADNTTSALRRVMTLSRSICRVAITNTRVFPLPVGALTQT